MKFYIKKVSNQDVEKTTVINNDAARLFFGVKIPNKNDEATIKIKYLPDETIDPDVILRKKQDVRIFIDRRRFNEGDLLLFTNEGNSLFTLEILNPSSVQYSSLNASLTNNFLLTDSLPDSTLPNLVSEATSEYNTKTMQNPLNQIFYGPPGTGKTDSTVEKALEILDTLSTEPDEGKKREENRETFRDLLNKRIFFVSMHPSYSYEDFVHGIKPKTSDKKELLFESKDGIFKRVSDISKKIYEDEGEFIASGIDNRDILTLSFFLSKFNSKSDKKANKFFGDENYSKTYETLGKKFNINPNSLKNHRDKFDFLASTERKGWQPRNGNNNKLDNSESWPYNDIYDELKDKSFEQVIALIRSIEDKVETKVRKSEMNINYVLILDEINRANISKVFGELITLLEEDKRIGNENELSVILPSDEIFSVPPNLYIIGTMNTADKSIALVDIALRRRFQFIPVYPDSTIITKFCKSSDKENKVTFMNEINAVLRKEKSVDFQIGHAYFLKNNSLKDVINENVIPLLIEYFRSDLEKVKKLMSDIDYTLDDNYFSQTGLLRYN